MSSENILYNLEFFVHLQEEINYMSSQNFSFSEFTNLGRDEALSSIVTMEAIMSVIATHLPVLIKKLFPFLFIYIFPALSPSVQQRCHAPGFG